MSVVNTDRVDASGVRDRWFVVMIHAFEAWQTVEEPANTFHKKLATAFAHLEDAHTLVRASRLPARVVLVSRDPVPPEVRAICTDYGVTIEEGD